jgi:hypothetical protein
MVSSPVLNYPFEHKALMNLYSIDQSFLYIDVIINWP